MTRNNEYITKQKVKIMDIIKSYNHPFTIKNIFDELNQEIGLTTIYRFVDKLASRGLISKTLGENNLTLYQYLEKCDNENHFYLKCDKCGNLEHIDCDCIIELTSHILKKHKFTPNRDHIIISGTCKKCGAKNEEK